MKTRKMGLASALTVNPGLAAGQLNSSAGIVAQHEPILHQMSFDGRDGAANAGVGRWQEPDRRQ